MNSSVRLSKHIENLLLYLMNSLFIIYSSSFGEHIIIINLFNK